LFVDEERLPKAGEILGISLKEEKARAGKATAFRKILTGGDDYVTEKDPAQEAITKLVAILNGITRRSGRYVGPYYWIGDTADAIASIRLNKKSLSTLKDTKEALTALEANLNALFAEVLGSAELKTINKKNVQTVIATQTNIEVGPKSKKSKAKYIYPSDDSEIIKSLHTSIKDYKESVFTYAADTYKKSRAAFIKTLVANGFSKPTDPEVKFTKTDDEDSIANIANLVLKKAGCYDVASKLLDGFQKQAKLKLPKAFSSLITKDRNVFLALTAFAISQGGISPTFFKLIGSENPNGSASMHRFPSDGVVTLKEGGKVNIKDSQESAGFAAEFICQINEEGKVKDKYQVNLGFSYAGDAFKIEVNELIDVK
jgi:hypothetical protein